MSSLERVSAHGHKNVMEDQTLRGSQQSLHMEPLLNEGPPSGCSRHDNAADCDWACGHFSLAGSELIENPEQAPEEGRLNRESVNGNHPLQMGGSLTGQKKEGAGVNKGGLSVNQGLQEGEGANSQSPANNLSHKMKQAYLSGIDGTLNKGQQQVNTGLTANQRTHSSPPLDKSDLVQSEIKAQLSGDQRTQSSPSPDLCQLERKETAGKTLEKTSSGTTFTSFWRRPALQLFRKQEDAHVAPQLKDTRSSISVASSRPSSPPQHLRRPAVRTSSAPLNMAGTKSAGSQQSALQTTPSPSQRALFRSPDSSPDAFSYFEPPRSHQYNQEDEQSVNTHHRVRSEPPHWKQQQPPTVVENVEWNMDEEDEENENGGQAQAFGGRSEGGPDRSKSFGGRSEGLGGRSRLAPERSEVRGGFQSQHSDAPSWVDYSVVVDEPTESKQEARLEIPNKPTSQSGLSCEGSKGSAASGGSSVLETNSGEGPEGKKRRRRNRGRWGRKKASSDGRAAAEAGENDSVASDSSSLRGPQGSGSSEQGGSLSRAGGGVDKRVGNKIDVHLPAKEGRFLARERSVGSQERGSCGNGPMDVTVNVPPSAVLTSSGHESVRTSAGSKLQKSAVLHQGGGVSGASSVNASVMEPDEPRLVGDRWQHVVRRSEPVQEGPDTGDVEDIDVVEEDNSSDEASYDDLSDMDDLAAQEPSRGTPSSVQTVQELTRGVAVQEDFYYARGGQQQAQEEADYGEDSRHSEWEPERGVGLNRWHVVAMIGCSILTAFVGGRLYFEHLRRVEARRRAEKSCRIPIFGFGEVEVAERLRPLVCPNDHKGYV